MKILVKQSVRNVIAGTLFLSLMAIIYYTNSYNNSLKEPWDVLFSVVVPIVLIRLITIVIPNRIIGRNRGDYADMLLTLTIVMIGFANIYLIRNYWYNLSAFWSFVLSVVLPGLLFGVIIYFSYKRNKKISAK